ncbi:MAG: hypothetical protein QM627_00810 [Luteolibacter sp.]
MRIRKCPESRPVQMRTVVRLLLVILSVALAYSLVTQLRDAKTLSKTKEFQTHRHEILGKIQHSIDTNNWRRIHRLEMKYGAVKDPELVQALETAKALMQQTAARQTLTVGKVLDLSRQMESRPDLPEPQPQEIPSANATPDSSD